MYIARERKNGTTQFYLRQSYPDGNIMLSRELMHLGHDPGLFVKYPSRGSFYIDERVEEALRNAGIKVTQHELEEVFWFFVPPEIKRKYEFARSRSRAARKTPLPATEFHLFDRRRLHFLRFGQMDQSRLFRASPRMFQKLAGKSRDEIEQYFIREEMILSAEDLKSYVYVIFDLQKHFYKSYATEMPQGLNQEEVDGHFISEICRLNRDKRFWAGMETDTFLHDYLKRYMVMFFDFGYARSRYLDEILQNWINSKREFRFPQKKRVDAIKRGSSIFGVSEPELKKMSKKKLARLYRRKARELHPDRGGNQKEFIELTEIYQAIRTGSK